MSKLATMRKARGLSQVALAYAADVNIRSLQSYESGARDFNKADVTTVYKLARALGCNMEDLIDTENI